MSSESYSDDCPNCGNWMECSRGSNPMDTMGTCMFCGYYYTVVAGQVPLSEINLLRQEYNQNLLEIEALGGKFQRKQRMLTKLPYMKKSLLIER